MFWAWFDETWWNRSSNTHLVPSKKKIMIFGSEYWIFEAWNWAKMNLNSISFKINREKVVILLKMYSFCFWLLTMSHMTIQSRHFVLPWFSQESLLKWRYLGPYRYSFWLNQCQHLNMSEIWLQFLKSYHKISLIRISCKVLRVKNINCGSLSDPCGP